MYSILPALVGLTFLGYGLYVLIHNGVNRISSSFFGLCLTSFVWQCTWAILFQTHDSATGDLLIKVGYFFIIFLPTFWYHFLVEISNAEKDKPWVIFSYLVAFALAFLLVTTNWFVDGHYAYFWGYYPKAGLLHPIHLIQTTCVMGRGVYLTIRQQAYVSLVRSKQLKMYFASLLIYQFAAIDYLCNYGVEFYPPGVLFIAVSMGLMVRATRKFDLMNPLSLAASVAHEIRTPLASIRLQASTINDWWPILLKSHQLAIENGLVKHLSDKDLARLQAIPSSITREVDRSNAIIETLLSSAANEKIDSDSFAVYSMTDCVNTAIEQYPFGNREREKIESNLNSEFKFYGSQELLTQALFNLIKNALYVLKEKPSNAPQFIRFYSSSDENFNYLHIQDSGCGISREHLPYVFEPFYSTKKGSGIGLAFCKRVMRTFDGDIYYSGKEDQFTQFTLRFPLVKNNLG